MTTASRRLAAFLIALSLSPVLHAETPPFQNPDPAKYLFEDQISPGMKGYGLTVMHAGKIEKFDVEVIDVIHNFSPGMNGILVRCTGLGLEHSGIIAGMSGSPVYINDKMIGAVAFGWGMAKDPIAGVQPIRNMLALPAVNADAIETRRAAQAGGSRWSSGNFLAKQAAALPGWSALAKSLSQHAPAEKLLLNNSQHSASSMRPLASPLMVGGGSASTLKLLEDTLSSSNFVPLASGTGEGGTAIPFTQPNAGEKPLGGIAQLKPNEIQLAPGSAIAVPLVTGDLDLSAIGTVTEVRNGKVYAFGHAFNADGGTMLPMATAYIYTIMPNLSESFKVGTTLNTVGTLVTDEQTGIVGLLGEPPATVPVTISVKDTDGTINKTYHYQLSPYPKLIPEVLNAALNETLVAQRGLPHQFTIRINGSVSFNTSAGPVTLDLTNVGTTDSYNPTTTILPIAMLVDNPFENLQLKNLTLNATIENTNEGGSITAVHVDRMAAVPGQTLHAVIDIKPFQQEIRSVPLDIKIPDDCKDGDYQLTVGSSSMALMQEMIFAADKYDPQNVNALSAGIERILAFKSDALYATLVMNVSGMAISGHEMKNLPGSRIAIYASDRRTDATPVFNIASASTDAGCIIDTGGESFSIKVNHNADRRYFNPKSTEAGNPLHNGNQPTSNPMTNSHPDGAPAPDPNN